jgi:hypothetical protein
MLGMRYSFLLVVLVAATGGGLLASCGKGGDAGDMATSPDMAASLNCIGVARCVYSCLANHQGDLNTCPANCQPLAKTGSTDKWIAAVLCGQSFCTANGNADAGNAKCIEIPAPTGGTVLCDPGLTYQQCSTAQSKVCLPCLDQARNFWIYDLTVSMTNPGPPTGMCSMPSSPDCMGAKAACPNEFGACVNDP